ncbi:hypothetical protein BVER_00586c [Candidatus Burkholderia verschuerenii]|uniref:DUF3800 domain-containing protein n=1 Tax=Candidatus Burkholderia verschuerenii TaxID=242163 RepID=A0A0L0M4K6_9BURK|nr:DUF3800 domain-containing protein [Candidatus Burkholderia verschuerenii]KND57226.1 hypothetical protein BVER_00586c [Candidatus Burkholderia verschuerenii]
MHYVVYLDEFGHIGPYVSRTHEKYNDSPVFGFAGVVIPAQEVREFAIYFYQLKCRLLAWDLKNKNPGNRPAYQWEKKGSAVYTVTNVEKYRELRNATFRLLNHIHSIGGHVFYTGEHKTILPKEHDSAETFKRQLVQTIRKLDRFCAKSDCSFLVLLDEQEAGDKWREGNVEACTLAMFEDPSEKCRTLIEPPLQGESHLFQTLQCADWICGLVGRLTAFAVAPGEYADWEIFHKYFHDRIQETALPCSGLEHQKAFTVPAEVAGEHLPDAAGRLAGT